MSVSTNQNERSQAIDLITEMNLFLSSISLRIKRVGGENTIRNSDSINRRIMFPDVLLYSDMNKTEIIQGWEIKLPDIPVTDEIYIKDAQYKADILGLQSTVLWNFNTIVLYVKQGDNWILFKQWDDLSFIKNRNDVVTYRQKWISFLRAFIIELDVFFTNGSIVKKSLAQITDQATASIINNNKSVVTNYISEKIRMDRRIKAYIDTWWEGAKYEFLNDESDSVTAYSKVILLGWTTRIIFAHSIKEFHTTARLIDNIENTSTPSDLNNIFNEITKNSDFYTIFESKRYDELIPDYTWEYLLELSKFLEDKKVGHNMLQSILEESVNLYKREILGQFTTPEKLAQLLVGITVINVEGMHIDPCCGTGIIPKKIIQLKETLGFSEKEAHETTWASDKMQMPLQISNMAMTTPTSMKILNKVLQKNIFSLRVGDNVAFRSPDDGSIINLKVPKFDNIISNLPFVPFEIINSDEKEHINKLRMQLHSDSSGKCSLSERSDYYSYILLKLHQLLGAEGRVGVITSNSWLGTESGKKLYKALLVYYKVRTIVISGKGKWFGNADVMTSLIVLEKKDLSESNPNKTDFIVLKERLGNLSSNDIDQLSNHILNSEYSEKTIKSSYTENEISSLLAKKLSLNSLFFDISWIDAIYPNLVSLKDYFTVIRGMRRGWDPLFYPDDNIKIELEYIQPILKSSKEISYLTVSPDKRAFCCSETINELENLGHSKALAWINRFKNGVNGKGIPLQKVLASKNKKWYEMKADGAIAEFVTAIAPNKRLFWATLTSPSFINQRLIGLNRKDNAKAYPKKLFSALLNSIIGLFFIEASGFGRGLGVLDLNKNNIEKTAILDPTHLSEASINNIIELYENLNDLIGGDIRVDLDKKERIAFDKYILNCYGIKEYYDSIRKSLFDMMETRLSVKD